MTTCLGWDLLLSCSSYVHGNAAVSWELTLQQAKEPERATASNNQQHSSHCNKEPYKAVKNDKTNAQQRLQCMQTPACHPVSRMHADLSQRNQGLLYSSCWHEGQDGCQCLRQTVAAPEYSRHRCCAQLQLSPAVPARAAYLRAAYLPPPHPLSH